MYTKTSNELRTQVQRVVDSMRGTPNRRLKRDERLANVMPKELDRLVDIL